MVGYTKCNAIQLRLTLEESRFMRSRRYSFEQVVAWGKHYSANTMVNATRPD